MRVNAWLFRAFGWVGNVVRVQSILVVVPTIGELAISFRPLLLGAGVAGVGNLQYQELGVTKIGRRFCLVFITLRRNLIWNVDDESAGVRFINSKCSGVWCAT